MKALTLQRVCDRLGVARKTVLLLVKRGKLHGYTVGRQWRFDEADVESYVAAQKAEAARRSDRAKAPHVAPTPRQRAIAGTTNWKGSTRYLQ